MRAGKKALIQITILALILAIAGCDGDDEALSGLSQHLFENQQFDRDILIACAAGPLAPMIEHDSQTVSVFFVCRRRSY